MTSWCFSPFSMVFPTDINYPKGFALGPIDFFASLRLQHTIAEGTHLWEGLVINMEV